MTEPVKNLRFVLARRPEGPIRPDDFRAVHETLPALEPGQALVRQVFMSLDPAMRGWMSDNRDSYVPPVEIGETMRSFGVGVIAASRIDELEVGTRVSGRFGWTQHAIVGAEDITPLPVELSLEVAVAVLGLPGATAWYGLFEVGKPKPGETLLVSGAAGSVGSLVGQMAKAEGLRVIGIAGSAEKCTWLVDELGFDDAINYRSDDVAAAVKKLAPDGVDIYFENVGGELLQIALNNMNTNGRLVMCGLISQYNATDTVVGPNLMRMVTKRLTMQGFVMTDHLGRFGEFARKVGTYLQQGSLHYRTDIVVGLEQAPTAINKLFDGTNQGKLIIKVS